MKKQSIRDRYGLTSKGVKVTVKLPCVLPTEVRVQVHCGWHLDHL